MDWQHVAIGLLLLSLGGILTCLFAVFDWVALLMERETNNAFRVPAYLVAAALLLVGTIELVFG